MASADTLEPMVRPEEPYAPLRAEHADLVRGLDDVQRYLGPEDQRAERWDRLAAALEAHARAEEYSLFPRLRRLPATRDIAREALVDHFRMREIVRALDATPADDPEYHLLLSELTDVVRRHLDLEEYALMPLALSALGEQAVDRIVTACVRQRTKLVPLVTDERAHLGHPRRRARRG